MTSGRSGFTLIEESDLGQPGPELPSAHHVGGRAKEPRERGAAALIAAIDLLSLRGEGPEPFTVSPSTDPIAFLLDATADAVSVWCGTTVLYRNRAAERLESCGHPLERRTLRFRRHEVEYLLEIVTLRG